MKQNTIVKPIARIDYTQCCNCGEYFNSGFFLDDQFYCRSCVVQDFQEYLNMRKESDI